MMRRLKRAFDHMAGIPDGDGALRADLLDTAMLRPLGLVTASLGFMMMSAAACIITRTGWAAAWLILDTLMLLCRLVPAVIAWRRGQRVPERMAIAIIAAACLMFATFGLGCAASFDTGNEDLRIGSALAVMGLLAGLATRWAALPRLAAIMIVVVSAPMAVAIGRSSAFGGSLFLVLAAGTAVLAMQNNRTLRAMLAAERKARVLAETDMLTGLLDRNGLNVAIGRLMSDDLSVIYLDLDGFKGINDHYGHAAGDQVLVEIGARLQSIAVGQPVARIGGDEFVIVLAADALMSGDDVVAALRDSLVLPIALADPAVQVQVGFSHGLASGSVARQSLAAICAQADKALYAAKRALKAGNPTTGRVAAA